MNYPALMIDLQKIAHNAKRIARLLGPYGIGFIAVNKGTSADPRVARALMEGNPLGFGDSRLGNIRRLREFGYKGEVTLLRAPLPSEAPQTVALADASFCSHVETAVALGEAARSQGKTHDLILAIDLGDRREGVMPEDAPSVAKAMSQIPGVRLSGIATNLACFGAVVPDREKMEILLSLKEEIESVTGEPILRVSGGNSASIPMLLRGEMPTGITELRLGEAILLGTEAVERTLIPGCERETFLVLAKVIEIMRKPSVPWGTIGQDAFGNTPSFKDTGVRRRAILAIGRQDVDPDGLRPRESGVTILGASSDHLICDVEDSQGIKLGSTLSFVPDYGALMRMSTSPYVEKVVKS